MITVGYGDISPTTYVEKQLTIVLTLVSCGIFAYVINTIGDIFREISVKSASIKMKKYWVTQYMLKRNISKSNKMKILRSLEYQDQQIEKGNIKGLNILQDMQQDVREEMFKEYYTTLLKNSQIIKQGKYSQQFIENLALKLDEITTSPGQEIIQQNIFENKYFFIMEGSVELYYKSENQEKTITNLQSSKEKTHEIGQEFLYNQNQSKYSVRSTSVSRLVFFNTQDFLDILQQSPDDYEKYIFISHQNKYGYKAYQSICKICNSITHNFLKCPITHFIPNTLLLHGKSNQPFQQTRQRYLRNFTGIDFKQTFNAYLNKSVVKEDLIKIKTDQVSKFFEDQLDYLYYEQDIEFYFNTPMLKFDENETLMLYQEDSEEEMISKEHFQNNDFLCQYSDDNDDNITEQDSQLENSEYEQNQKVSIKKTFESQRNIFQQIQEQVKDEVQDISSENETSSIQQNHQILNKLKIEDTELGFLKKCVTKQQIKLNQDDDSIDQELHNFNRERMCSQISQKSSDCDITSLQKKFSRRNEKKNTILNKRIKREKEKSQIEKKQSGVQRNENQRNVTFLNKIGCNNLGNSVVNIGTLQFKKNSGTSNVRTSAPKTTILSQNIAKNMMNLAQQNMMLSPNTANKQGRKSRNDNRLETIIYKQIENNKAKIKENNNNNNNFLQQSRLITNNQNNLAVSKQVPSDMFTSKLLVPKNFHFKNSGFTDNSSLLVNNSTVGSQLKYSNQKSKIGYSGSQNSKISNLTNSIMINNQLSNQFNNINNLAASNVLGFNQNNFVQQTSNFANLKRESINTSINLQKQVYLYTNDGQHEKITKLKDQFFDIVQDFEISKKYEIYFPNYNQNQIIQKIKNIYQKNNKNKDKDKDKETKDFRNKLSSLYQQQKTQY